MSTTPLVIAPKMLIGENPPALAPLMISRLMRTGLIPWRFAKDRPTGAMIATAAGTTAPKAVRIEMTTNITHGMSATRPPTIRTAACTSQSTVPLFFAIANRYVTPTRMMNRSAGKPARTSSGTSCPKKNPPTTKAATKARAPMLTGSNVAARKTRTKPRIGISSSGMRRPS